MKKYLLSALVIFTFTGYVFITKIQEKDEVSVIPPDTSNADTNTHTLPVKTSIPQVTSTKESYKDGEYTGDLIDAFYGDVQVKAIIQNGKISDVEFVDFPHDRKTSQEINRRAMPLLRQEAVQAQSSDVDTVSGATQTSKSFRVSLDTALKKAKI